jgi:hypothetical protein
MILFKELRKENECFQPFIPKSMNLTNPNPLIPKSMNLANPNSDKPESSRRLIDPEGLGYL